MKSMYSISDDCARHAPIVATLIALRKPCRLFQKLEAEPAKMAAVGLSGGNVKLGLAIFIPVLLRAAASVAWLPDWLGAGIAVAALFGALTVLWRSGAMRLGIFPAVCHGACGGNYAVAVPR
jgi:hypothetical protein